MKQDTYLALHMPLSRGLGHQRSGGLWAPAAESWVQ